MNTSPTENSKSFLKYIQDHHILWLWVLLFAFLSQGTILLTNTIGVDTADAIHTMTRSDIQAEFSVGRQGIVWIKFLTGHILVNPLFAGVFTIFALTLTAMLWSYLLYYVSGIENGGAILSFSLILCSSTIFLETFYFKVQALEIAIGMCLAGLSLLFTYLWITKGKIGWLTASIGLMLIYMSTYQALVLLFVIGAQMCFLLHFGCNILHISNRNSGPDSVSQHITDHSPDSKADCSMKNMWSFVLKFIFAFALGLGINQLISKLFFSSGNAYLDNLFYWTQRPLTESLYNLAAYSFKTLVGIGIYYPETYPGMVLLTLFLLFLSARASSVNGGHPSARASKKDGNSASLRGEKILYGLNVLLLMLSPAYLPIAIGGRIPHRTQFNLPFTLAFCGWLAIVLLKSLNGRAVRFLSYLAAALVFLTCYRQLSVDLDLGYTDQMRYQTDSAIAHDLIRAIDDLQGDLKKDEAYPLVFVGSYEKPLNPSCVIGEVTGRSMFAWDVEPEPVGVWSGGRCLAFLNCLGGDYTLADSDTIAAIYADSSDIPAYPAQDCVQLRDGVIVIKLSEP